MNFEEIIFNHIQDAITSSSIKLTELPAIDPQLRKTEIAKIQILYRFASVYKEFEEDKSNLVDLLILLRQLIRTYRAIEVSNDFYQLVEDKLVQFDLMGRQTDQNVLISATDWNAPWLYGSENIDRFENRSIDEQILGDGLIASMDNGWQTYRSSAQKIAVDSWVFAPPGTTTLVTLPTGSGKSLCTILPAWYDSKGGENPAGTTIVIVPTVALALDQQKQARQFFPKSRGQLFEPISRTGSNTPESREDINQAILDGTLPILYTSPESLLQSNLYFTCIKAARKGLITRFVIDEAHLIDSWGADFRTDFQLLSTYRKRLLRESNGRLKTLLLSATINSEGIDTLSHLFSEQDNLITIQANRVRNEIDYYLDHAPNEETRKERVLEALKYVPRPAILYVTQPKQADEWLDILQASGYKRIATFHGETNDKRRFELIQEWENDQVDLMIATSAFGLGIDKKHVRSVIHATLPENIDRLYQEVGRGGRDGCRSISLVCITDSDYRLAQNLTPKRLTVEKAYPRWQSMMVTHKMHPELPNVFLVDRDVTRRNAPTMKQNDANQNWNIKLLLMMQRARMIKIVEIPPISWDEEEKAIDWISIEVLIPDIVGNRQVFEEKLEEFREGEKQAIIDNISQTFKMIGDFTKNVTDAERYLGPCLALQIGRNYERSQITCSGCPTCEAIPVSERPYPLKPIQFHIDFYESIASNVRSNTINPKHELDEVGSLKQKLGNHKELILTWDGMQNITHLRNRIEEIIQIFWMGVEQIILPPDFLDKQNMETFIHGLAEPSADRTQYIHRVIPINLVNEHNVPIFPIHTMIIYPTNPKLATATYDRLQEAKQDKTYPQTIIHIVHENLEFEDGRKFVDVVEGIHEPIDWIIDEDDNTDTYDFF